MTATKVCASRTCSNKFTPQGNRRKYCSLACSKRENQRKYAENNPDKVREGMRQWEAKNREHRRAYQRENWRKWRTANLDRERTRARKYARKWRKEHHDQFIAMQRKRYAANRGTILEKRRAKEGSIAREKYLARIRKPKKRGRPEGNGRPWKGNEQRIAFCAYHKLKGMKPYQLARIEWPEHLEQKSKESFLSRQKTAIALKAAELSTLSEAELNIVASGLGLQ